MKDIISDFNPNNHIHDNKSSKNIIVHGNGGKKIKARTRNQKMMVDLSEDHDILFAIVNIVEKIKWTKRTRH